VEGNGSRSLFICPQGKVLFSSIIRFMASDPQFTAIENLLIQILAEKPEIFLVQIKIKPTNNIKVFIDTDEGITIDRCIRVNRQLYQAIEEAGLYPEGDFSLEVSSPGIGEPILLTRQYRKNIGRHLAVTLKDERKLEGVLTDLSDDGLVLEETRGKGKKLEKVLHTLLFEDIKKAVVEVKF
jgi:ribosome maturation factor RimP